MLRALGVDLDFGFVAVDEASRNIGIGLAVWLQELASCWGRLKALVNRSQADLVLRWAWSLGSQQSYGILFSGPAYSLGQGRMSSGLGAWNIVPLEPQSGAVCLEPEAAGGPLVHELQRGQTNTSFFLSWGGWLSPHFVAHLWKCCNEDNRKMSLLIFSLINVQ